MIVPENPYAIADVSAAPSAIALACRTLWIPPKSEEPTLAAICINVFTIATPCEFISGVNVAIAEVCADDIENANP